MTDPSEVLPPFFLLESASRAVANRLAVQWLMLFSAQLVEVSLDDRRNRDMLTNVEVMGSRSAKLLGTISTAMLCI